HQATRLNTPDPTPAPLGPYAERTGRHSQTPGPHRQHDYELVRVIPDHPPGIKEFTPTKRLG
ncbi:N-acetyltransferase, partial [Streptomyces sp. NPDC056696]